MIGTPVIREKFNMDWYDNISAYDKVILATSDKDFAEELNSQGITCLTHPKLNNRIADIVLSRNTIRCYFLEKTTDAYILWIDSTYNPTSDEITQITQREEDVVFKRQIPLMLVPDMAFALTKRAVMEKIGFRYETDGACECFNLWKDAQKLGFSIGWL